MERKLVFAAVVLSSFGVGGVCAVGEVPGIDTPGGNDIGNGVSVGDVLAAGLPELEYGCCVAPEGNVTAASFGEFAPEEVGGRRSAGAYYGPPPLRPLCLPGVVRRWWFSVHGDILLPWWGYLADSYDVIAPGVVVDWGRIVLPCTLWIYVFYSYNHLSADVPGVEDTYITDLNAGLRYRIPTGDRINPYVGAGPGWYHFGEGGRDELGVEAGAGVVCGIINGLALDGGGGIHFVFDDSDTKFARFHVGVLF